MVKGEFKDGTILQEKLSRGTLRKVLYTNDRIYKHFTMVKWPGDLRKPWRLEASALKFLQEKGIECPQLVSLHESSGEAELCKEFVVGEPLSKVSMSNVELVAATLARINAAGVFTCDPHVGNFLEVATDKITFIDFGRSRIYRTRSLFFLLYLGKERARIAHLLLPGTEGHVKEAFWNAYTESLGVINDPASIAVISEKYWLKRMDRRALGKEK